MSLEYQRLKKCISTTNSSKNLVQNNKKNTFTYTAGIWNLLCSKEYHWVFWEKTIFSMKINELKINTKKTKINILPRFNRTLQLHHAAETGMGANLLFYRYFSIVSSKYIWKILNFFSCDFFIKEITFQSKKYSKKFPIQMHKTQMVKPQYILHRKKVNPINISNEIFQIMSK